MEILKTIGLFLISCWAVSYILYGISVNLINAMDSLLEREKCRKNGEDYEFIYEWVFITALKNIKEAGRKFVDYVKE